MWSAVRLLIAFATCGVMLASGVFAASPSLLLGEAKAQPRLLRESGPIEARLPQEEPRSYCDCVVRVPDPPVRIFNLETTGGIGATLYEPPSEEIEKPFSKAHGPEPETEPNQLD